jgi:queuosine precursor transporter
MNVKNTEPSYKWFPFVTAGFVTALIISNLIAVKIVTFGSLFLPAAVIIFPISYIFGDVLTEVYGFARARQVIWMGFFWNLFAVAAIWIGGLLPPAPFWEGQDAYSAIFGFAPRVLGASFVAYLFGEFLNSFVLAKLKVATEGKHLWLRTIASTLIGQLADSAIFLTLAFVGTPVFSLQLIVTQWLFKSVYEALATPLTYVVVNALKRAEGIDVYDRATNFNPLPIAE